MTQFVETFTGAAGALSTGYIQVYTFMPLRDGSGLGIGENGEESGALRNGEAYGNDQIVTWTLTSTPDGRVTGALLRGSNSGTVFTGYRIAQYGAELNWIIDRITAGTSTNLASGTGSVVANDIFQARAIGTVLSIWKNGVQMGSYDTNPDGTKYSSGMPGMYFFSNPTVDNFTFEDTGGNTGVQFKRGKPGGAGGMRENTGGMVGKGFDYDSHSRIYVPSNYNVGLNNNLPSIHV